MKNVPDSIINIWTWVRALSAGLVAALICTGYLAFILAECNHYSLLPCMICAVLTAGITIWLARKRLGPSTLPEISAWLFVGMIAIGSLCMTTPPGELILGGWDPGVYIHTAAAISRDGGLQIQAQDATTIPPSAWAFLYKDVGGSKQPFQGMFRIEGDKLSPQFMHLYPSLLAVGYSLSGVWGALLVNPILNVLAICLIYWFSAKIVGPKWALAVACLFALNPAQIWQAKFSTAEILTQSLLLLGFGTLLDSTTQRIRILPAMLSGLSFGLAFLTRYDAVLIIVPTVVLVILTLHKPEQKRVVPAFLVPLCLLGIHAWVHMKVVAPCYRPLPDLVFPLLQFSLLTAGLLLVTTMTRPGRLLLQRISSQLPVLKACFICGFTGFLFFAWYIRPHLVVDGRILSLVTHTLSGIGKPEWLNLIGGENALNIHFLTAIFGWFGLLSGCVGVLFLAWRIRTSGIAIWLIASVFTMIILLSNVFNDHFMMWVSRRFIPTVIPLIVIGIVVAARELYTRFASKSPILAIGLSAILLGIVTLTTVPATYRMANTRDWQGLCAWFDDLAQSLPAGASVYCDQPGFAAPLRFMYNVRSFESYGDKSLSEYLLTFRQALNIKNGNTYILTTRQQPELPGMTLQKMKHLTLRSHIQLQPKYSIPTGVKERGGDFTLYLVTYPDFKIPRHQDTAAHSAGTTGLQDL